MNNTSESNTLRKLIKEEVLNTVAGGKKGDEEGGICRYCNQEYKGDWGTHVTKECPNNPYK